MRSRFATFVAALTASILFCALPLAAQDYTVSGNTPGFIKKAVDLGPADATQQINVTVWLNLQNEQQLQNLIKNQHTQGNAQYHQWITQDSFNSQFAPTAQQVNALSNFLSAKNLKVVDTAENRFYVKAQGSVADVQKAFHVQIDNYKFNGQVYRSNKSDPNVNNAIGAHVAAITGLDDYGYQPNIQPQTDAEGNAISFPLTQNSDGTYNTPDGTFITKNCFSGATTANFALGTSSGSYSGNPYTICGYNPSEIRTAYDFNGVYSQGLTGAGQTVVIVDGYGSPTIEQDAALFSAVYGLPAINSSNFQIIKAQGLTNNPHTGGWPGEVTLDVEWVHAVAPGANIALVVSPSNNALDEAINLAVSRGLGNTISNSWSTVEGFGNPRGFDRVNRILWNAAAKGINVNFSSGDYGDNVTRVGFKTVDFPSSSPYATSVGGTSLGLNPDKTMAFQTGWGTNDTRIAQTATSAGQAPAVPPLFLGFLFGAGGGSSTYYARPAFQSGLTVPGSTRVTPDISMVADPYTGVEIIQTDTATGKPYVSVIGGTSLACPLFSGVTALAAQKAGHGLGQVGATAYSIAASDPAAFYDVLATPPVASPSAANNVTGSTTVNGTTTTYDANALVKPDPAITGYLSALYHGSSTRWYVLSFGTDSTLPVGPGWDYVTGLGTPNVPAFVNDLAK